ncbi:hypothetical protein [Streptomyces sp. NPDC088350]|uniref:hypothetical protein n=1 Tax=Streptomyces sp. NPDC088350 TaxID=3365854 RepID=UPI003820760F
MFLAEASRGQLDCAVSALRAEGHAAHGVSTDVAGDKPARTAADEGWIVAGAHTAGVSASIVSARTILEVDLLGTVRVIDAFEPVAGWGAPRRRRRALS